VRNKLKTSEFERFRLRTTVTRKGSKRGWNGETVETILFGPIVRTNTGEILTDHLWFTVGDWCRGLHPGDVVEFDARVKKYRKGYVNHRRGIDEEVVDYRLSNPTNLELLQPTKQANNAAPRDDDATNPHGENHDE